MNALMNVVPPAKPAGVAPAAATAPAAVFGVTLKPPPFVHLNKTERKIFDWLVDVMPANVPKELDAFALVEVAKLIARLQTLEQQIEHGGATALRTMTNGSVRECRRRAHSCT